MKILSTHERPSRKGNADYFTGNVWIDPATSRVMRIEMFARDFPGNFATDHVESATDYQYVRLGGTDQYIRRCIRKP